MGQLYSDVLYLSTSLAEWYVKNVAYSRPEPYYLWFYFLFLNGIWLVVPLCMSKQYWGGNFADKCTVLLYRSCKATAEVFAGWQEVNEIYRVDGGNAPEQSDVHLKLN